MSYELFQKAAALNSEFEVIPSKTSILAKGIGIDKNGYMQHGDKTYMPNMVKIADLPPEWRNVFKENKMLVQESTKIVAKENKNDNFEKLNKILFEQLQNIIDPDEGSDMSQELKKANTVCNVADKLIGIADLSLKAEMFYDKRNSKRSLYED